MEKISLIDVIFSKDEQNDGESSSREKAFFTREFSGSITKRLKRILSMRFFRISKALSYLLAHISTKVYGAALMSFGLLSALMYFLNLSHDNSIITPIIGISFACIAIPFLLVDKPLPIFLQDFGPTDYLFFEFFCMKRHTVMENEKKFPILGAVVIGAAPAILSGALPLWQIALAIGIIICVYIGMESPEFLYLASLATLPFIKLIPYTDTVLSVTLVLAVISFLRKVLYGKRVIYIQSYDIFLGAMLLFVLISGIFVKGVESFSGSVEMIVFALGYALACNIVTNRRLADRSANSIILPGAIAALVSIGQLIALIAQSGFDILIDDLNFMLARQDGMAVYFIAATVYGIGFIKHSGQPAKTIYVISVILNLLGLVLSGEVFAVIVLLVGVPAYAVLKSNKLIWLFLPVLLVLPVAILLLPNNVLNILFTYSPSISTAEELLALWEHCLEEFLNNIFVGIGIGSESFVTEMESLGAFGYTDSSNLFIELGLEAGVFALICFLMIIFTRIRHRAVRYLYVRNSQIESLSIASGVCLFCLLSFGFVNYIWSDASAYYLFWCIFGMGSASLRVAKRDYDDQVLYYEESSAHDSSVIDIEIG